ncbi:MAG: zinc and cadmium transporter [Pirellulaceae bacterium]|jgi:zinc and cadmium transporter
MAFTILIFYCVLIAAASLLGGWLPTLLRLTHTRMQIIMSLVSGIMLGVAMLHLLPRAAVHLPTMNWVCGLALTGLLVMFFILRLFHVHHHAHEVKEEDNHDHADHSRDRDHDHDAGHKDAGHKDAGHKDASHKHDTAHKHGPEPCPGQHPDHSRRYAWVGLFFGLVVHTLLDGVALSASVQGDAAQAAGVPGLTLLGFSTFLAVLLHKPLDALSITSLMGANGWPKSTAMIVNLGFAACCPMGAMMFFYGAAHLDLPHHYVIGAALAFSAGFFLCIALSDLLPEVAFHSHDRLKLSAALLLGIALSVGIELTHSHGPGTSVDHSDGPTPVEAPSPVEDRRN